MMAEMMKSPVSKSWEDLVNSTLIMCDGVAEIEEINEIEEVEEVIYSNDFLWQKNNQVKNGLIWLFGL